MATERTHLYRDDLAWIHHVGFGGFAHGATPGLLRFIRRAGVERGTLLDLGCGSGIWARAAQRAGFQVVGIDRSPAMIRLARQFSPGSRFRRGSLYDVRLPACDVVTAVGDVLNYLPGDGRRRPAHGQLFESVFQALRPGGLFIFDASLWSRPEPAQNLWRAGKDWAVLVQARRLKGKPEFVRQIIAFRKIGAACRRSEEFHRLQLFHRAALERMLRQAGFSCRVLGGYGRFRLGPNRRVFAARKPGLWETRRAIA